MACVSAQRVSRKILASSTLLMHIDVHNECISWKEAGMRTTLNIDDALIERASKITGINEKTALVRKGLEVLISLESSRRLAALGGSEKKIRMPRRRRPEQ
jgi:Arc/MetJ family transcription regulator